MTESTDGSAGRLLPFYLLADVSYSMEGEKLDQVNGMLPELADALIQNPIVSDKVRFSLIDFAGQSTVVLPLCDLNKVDHLPGLSLRTDGTSYAAAFKMLQSRIAAEFRATQGRQLPSSAACCLLHQRRRPTDDEHEWRGTFRDLTFYDRETSRGNPKYPNVIPFGVDQAERSTLMSLVHPSSGPKRMKLYMMAEGADAGKALAQMAEVLISSVLRSGDALAKGGGGVILPTAEELGDGINAFDPEEDLI